MSNTGKKIKFHRKRQGISQVDLAKTVGITQPSLSAIETCKSEPTNENLKKIADALSVKFEDLLSDDARVYADSFNRNERTNLVNNAQQQVQIGTPYPTTDPFQKPVTSMPTASTIDWPTKYFQLQEKYESILETLRQQEQQLSRLEVLLMRYQLKFGPIEGS